MQCGAAVARHRIQLTTGKPMRALWQTFGRCGELPQDPARILALLGTVLALLPWLLIPLGILFSWISENVGSIGA
ncbi:hypothetical protein MNBD_ACTINO02-2927 [hydrothermal vent metagenome]|uniref:Uncharacterized protein n=1 Tax=hydrothermal vent metagenome TaxID=652676 RepID=A0A3B0S3F1_9ZZZZ